MSKTVIAAVAAVCVAAGAAGTLVASRVLAADAEVEANLGGGVPTRVLAENNRLRVTLVSFPKGNVREGGKARRADQLIVYIDDSDFKTVPRAGAVPNPNRGVQQRPAGPIVCDPVKDCGPVGIDGNRTPVGIRPVGSVAYHPKGSITGTIVSNNSYRALYVELK